MKIIINIATYNSNERADTLNKVMVSLNNNTIPPDIINVYDNDYQNIDLTDKGKFYFLKDIDESQFTKPIYIFTCDDDILYPKTYIEDTIKLLEQYNNHIITYHGRILTNSGISYYRNHRRFRCLGTVNDNHIIDVAGTGVTAFNFTTLPKLLKEELINLYKLPDQKCSDLLFSRILAKHNYPILLAKHNSGYFKDLSLNQTTNCYKSMLKDQTNLIKLVDDILIYKSKYIQ